MTLRRMEDPINPENAALLDNARLLLADIAVADHLGLVVINAEARADDRALFVAWGPACTTLNATEIGLLDDSRYMQAERFGTRLRWFQPLEAA